jgi:hypothetical protein
VYQPTNTPSGEPQPNPPIPSQSVRKYVHKYSPAAHLWVTVEPCQEGLCALVLAHLTELERNSLWAVAGRKTGLSIPHNLEGVSDRGRQGCARTTRGVVRARGEAARLWNSRRHVHTETLVPGCTACVVASKADHKQCLTLRLMRAHAGTLTPKRTKLCANPTHLHDPLYVLTCTTRSFGVSVGSPSVIVIISTGLASWPDAARLNTMGCSTLLPREVARGVRPEY